MSGTRLALSPSWFLAAVILALHGAAAAALLVALPGWPGTALAALFVALGLAAAWSRALLRAARSPRVLGLGERLEVRFVDGTSFAGDRGSPYVSRILVTLPVGRRTVLITRDMLAEDEFRRLRLWALWGRLPRGSVAAAPL